MPKFFKNPKVIAGVLIGLWLAYVIYANFQLETVKVRLFPLGVMLEVRISTVIVASAIFGAVATLLVQFLWKRRSSKKASVSAAP